MRHREEVGDSGKSFYCSRMFSVRYQVSVGAGYGNEQKVANQHTPSGHATQIFH